MSSDYGSDIEFTPNDLQTIDLICARHASTVAGRASLASPGQHGRVEEEPTAADTTERSLFERFRGKSLYVTDFCAPAYCEVKYHYGLVGRRDLKPELRPAAIPRKDGGSIVIDKPKQQAADRILTEGKAVHKQLEREIQPEPQIVEITTKQDRVALRYINMALSVMTLREIGISREIPVVGFVDGFLVYGVIDEVQKRELPNQPKDESGNKGKLDYYFSSPSKPSIKHGYYAIDHKTRFARSLPNPAHSKSNRIQLMIYKSLWDTLAADACDYNALLSKQGVQSTDLLSDHFIAQMQQLLFESGYDGSNQLTTIQDACELCREAFLGVGKLQDKMDIVYRSRFSPVKRGRKVSTPSSTPTRAKRSVVADSVANEETENKDFPVSPSDITGAMQTPMLDVETVLDPITNQSETIPENHNAPNSPQTPKRRERGASQSAPDVLQKVSPSKAHQPYAAPHDNKELSKGDVIGVESFQHDENMLAEWLTHTGQFWRSEREPVGVEMADVSVKCRSCEFADGCEWLEEKAREVREAKERARLNAQTT